NPAVASLMQVTHTIPIVFTQASDPVGSGFVSNSAHPGGNITGFHSFEPAIAAKWLDVLKQLAPSVRRVAVLHDPGIAANTAFVRTAEAAAGTFGVTATAAGVHNAEEIERTLIEFAKEPDGGLVVAPAPPTFGNRQMIADMAVRLHLPAVYSYRFFVTSGDLASYSIDGKDLWRAAASYIDRILAGKNPAICRYNCRPNTISAIGLPTLGSFFSENRALAGGEFCFFSCWVCFKGLLRGKGYVNRSRAFCRGSTGY